MAIGHTEGSQSKLICTIGGKHTPDPKELVQNVKYLLLIIYWSDSVLDMQAKESILSKLISPFLNLLGGGYEKTLNYEYGLR